jgi:hypothetical protein
VARRQVDQLHAPAGEKRLGANEKRIGPLARKPCKGRIDLSAGARQATAAPPSSVMKSRRFH